MKRYITALILLLGGYLSATTVTGTISDVNGNRYANGTVSAFNLITGASMTPGATDANGSFSITLSPSTYLFTVCARPVNIGPSTSTSVTQVCSQPATPIIISGGSQDVSAQINAVAPILGPSVAALLAANNAFTGNNTHAGLETFNGQVALNNILTGAGSAAIAGTFGGSPTMTGNWTMQGSNLFTGVSNTFKTIQGVYQADQWCTNTNSKDQSCIQNIVNSACAGLTAGQNAYVPIFAPAGVYVFSSAVTLPGTGFCRLDIDGEHAAGVGGTEFLASGNTVTLFDLTNGQTDTGAFHHIWFQSQGTIATATNDALKLGKVGGQTLYDFYVEDSWFNGFNKAIDCINCSGVTLVRNSIELNNYGFWCAPASTDRCNSHVFVANRWFENGLGIADGGALRCDNTSGSANVGNITVSAGVMDFNGNFTAGVSGFAVKLINGCNTVSMAGVDFHDQTYDDINVSNSTDVTITGNTTATTNHLLINCFDCRGITATGNSIGKTDVGNASPHAVMAFQVSGATSANNVISSNSSSFTGGTTATAYLKTDAGTTGTAAFGNIYPALTQQQLYSSVLDTTALTRIAQQAYVSSASNPQLCAGDANVIGSSDKSVCLSYNIAGNTALITSVQNGVSYRPLLLNAVSGAGGTGGVQIGLSTFAQLGAPANGLSAYCSDCAITNPCTSGGTGALANRLNSTWQCGTATPTLTLKKGTGAGNYSSASTTPASVDGTNLTYTITIPTGWKLSISASGSVTTSTAVATATVQLYDGVCNSGTALQSIQSVPTAASNPESWSLNDMVTGDGASHTINLCYSTSVGADTVTMLNSTAPLAPRMLFNLVPSN